MDCFGYKNKSATMVKSRETGMNNKTSKAQAEKLEVRDRAESAFSIGRKHAMAAQECGWDDRILALGGSASASPATDGLWLAERAEPLRFLA